MLHDLRPAPVHLTARGIDVLQLVGGGLSSKRVAAQLGIAPRTVETYIEHIRMKMSATNRIHMVALAVADRLIRVGDGVH